MSERGLFGVHCTTEMNEELTLRQIHMLDLFKGLWRSDEPVRLSNARLGEWCKCKARSISNDITALTNLGYITCEYQKNGFRKINRGLKTMEDNSIIIDDGKEMLPTQTDAIPLESTCYTPTQPDANIKHKNIKQENKKPLEEKTNSEDFPELYFSDKERKKLIARYEKEGVGEYLGYALEKLQNWADANPKKFAQRTCHYRCMLDWPLERAKEQKIRDVRLQREENYLDKSRSF